MLKEDEGGVCAGWAPGNQEEVWIVWIEPRNPTLMKWLQRVQLQKPLQLPKPLGGQILIRNHPYTQIKIPIAFNLETISLYLFVGLWWIL